MPMWTPDRRWVGADVFIIGGGPSLQGFDWTLLHDKPTIGCNVAFRLGVEVVKVCFFSDRKWFDQFKEELKDFQGDVVTHCMALIGNGPMWLKNVRREPRGLHKHAIGFGGNSGCSAVNLALLMGARRVFLLGFDCKLGAAEQSHWHDWRIEAPGKDVYNKFMEGWRAIALDLPRRFPGCEIINLGPDSAIPFFPKANFEEYLRHENHCLSR